MKQSKLLIILGVILLVALGYFTSTQQIDPKFKTLLLIMGILSIILGFVNWNKDEN